LIAGEKASKEGRWRGAKRKLPSLRGGVREFLDGAGGGSDGGPVDGASLVTKTCLRMDLICRFRKQIAAVAILAEIPAMER